MLNLLAMSLTRHQKFRPLLIGAVTAVVVGGSGAAWACNGLLSNDAEAPRAELTTQSIELGAAATDSRPRSEASAERKQAREERKKERRKKHRNHGHHRPGHGPTATTEPSDPGETTGPEEPTTDPTTDPTDPTETTEPDETRTTEPTEPDETATTDPSDPGPTTPEEPTTEPTTDAPTTEPATEEPTSEPEETTTSPDGDPAGDSTLATAVIKIVNTERAAAGCEPVTQDPALTQAALTHSEKMEAASTMSHQLPGEADLGTRFTAAGYSGWRLIGENVAYGYTSAASVMNGWMNSTGHKANILNCSFDDIGVAAVTADNGTIWWTQTFGTQG